MTFNNVEYEKYFEIFLLSYLNQDCVSPENNGKKCGIPSLESETGFELYYCFSSFTTSTTTTTATTATTTTERSHLSVGISPSRHTWVAKKIRRKKNCELFVLFLQMWTSTRIFFFFFFSLFLNQFFSIFFDGFQTKLCRGPF